MKILVAPNGVSSVVVGGRHLIVRADGTVIVEDSEAQLLYPHGFTDTDAQEAPSLSQMTRGQMIMRAQEEFSVKLINMSDTKIRAMLEKTEAEREPDREQESGPVTRAELFACMRDYGLPASPSMSNSELRAAIQARVAADEVFPLDEVAA